MGHKLIASRPLETSLLIHEKIQKVGHKLICFPSTGNKSACFRENPENGTQIDFLILKIAQLIDHSLSYNSQNEGWYVVQDMEIIQENEVLPDWLKIDYICVLIPSSLFWQL